MFRSGRDEGSSETKWPKDQKRHPEERSGSVRRDHVRQESANEVGGKEDCQENRYLKEAELLNAHGLRSRQHLAARRREIPMTGIIACINLRNCNPRGRLDSVGPESV